MNGKIKIKTLTSTAKIPTRGSNEAAGYDIYSDQQAIIRPGECRKISTGIATEIPQGYFGAIYARSGLATKRGLRPAQGTAVIDSDYRGEWFIPLYNDSPFSQEVFPGDRIAQVVFQSYLPVEFDEVEELNDTSRGTGGFGSTGTN